MCGLKDTKSERLDCVDKSRRKKSTYYDMTKAQDVEIGRLQRENERLLSQWETKRSVEDVLAEEGRVKGLLALGHQKDKEQECDSSGGTWSKKTRRCKRRR